MPMLNIKECISVSLPMNVHEVLFSEGIIPDLFGGNTEWVGESDWTLTRIFDLENENSHIVTSGISTHANLFVNENFIGNVTNAFTEDNFEIYNLSSSKVEITVHLNSPIRIAREGQSRDPQIPLCPPIEQHGFCGIQHLRVPQYLFGWDWSFASASIAVNSITIQPNTQSCETQNLIDTVMDNEDVWRVHVRFLSFKESNRTLILFNELGEEIYSITTAYANITLTVKNVKAWFPKGHGEQALYTMRVVYSDDCEPQESVFGFRQVERIERGKTWYLQFNKEVRVDIKGVNIVPTSAFRDSTEEEVMTLLDSIEELGVNTVRQWGGGWYGSNKLYEEANKRGILVWEEVKLACASYPGNASEWMESLDKEIDQNLIRIHNNPSLVILSGDNEIEMMLDQNWFEQSEAFLNAYKASYTMLKREIRSRVEKINEGHVLFFPTSPEEGTDIHFYDYQKDCTDWRIYPSVESLVSEFGFQSWSFMTGDLENKDEDWRSSLIISGRNQRRNGNMEIWNQSVRLFPDLLDRGFLTTEEFIWTSQMTQAICVKAATESFRRQENNSGVMLWQLNDVWPTASWSLVDFDGLKKPAFYAAKTSFETDLISLFIDRDELVVVSLEPRTEPAIIEVVHLFTQNIVSRKTNISDKKNDEILRVNIADICLGEDRQCVAAHSPSNYVLLAPVRRPTMGFPNPVVKVSNQKITVSVSVPTPFIYIACGGLSRNFIFLSPRLWDSIDLEVRGECPDAPNVYSIWSKHRPVRPFEISFI